MIMERWIKERRASKGETLEAFTARANLGKVPGLEPGVELEELWLTE